MTPVAPGRVVQMETDRVLDVCNLGPVGRGEADPLATNGRKVRFEWALHEVGGAVVRAQLRRRCNLPMPLGRRWEVECNNHRRAAATEATADGNGSCAKCGTGCAPLPAVGLTV